MSSDMSAVLGASQTKRYLKNSDACASALPIQGEDTLSVVTCDAIEAKCGS